MFINWLIRSSVRTNEPTSLAWWEDSDTIMSILIHSVVTRWVEMIIYLVSCVSFYRFNSETEINFTWTPSPHVQLGGFTIRGSTDLAPLIKNPPYKTSPYSGVLWGTVLFQVLWLKVSSVIFYIVIIVVVNVNDFMLVLNIIKEAVGQLRTDRSVRRV